MSVKLGKISVTYNQEPDDNDSTNDMQELTITAQPCLLHLYDKGKSDHYLIIETNRFAVDGIDELIEILKDFSERTKDFIQISNDDDDELES